MKKKMNFHGIAVTAPLQCKGRRLARGEVVDQRRIDRPLRPATQAPNPGRSDRHLPAHPCVALIRGEVFRPVHGQKHVLIAMRNHPTKAIILTLLLTACATLASGQDATPTPQATPNPKSVPNLNLFDRALYNAEPFLDAALELPKEKFDALVAATQAHRSNPAVQSARKAEAAAPGDRKVRARQATQDAVRASDEVRKAVFAANLTEESMELIKTLNREAYAAKRRASSDAGFIGLTREDPQFDEIKKNYAELEKSYLQEIISSNLSETQKAAIEKARNP